MTFDDFRRMVPGGYTDYQPIPDRSNHYCRYREDGKPLDGNVIALRDGQTMADFFAETEAQFTKPAPVVESPPARDLAAEIDALKIAGAAIASKP